MIELEHRLQGDSPATSRILRGYGFGQGVARPKVYLQAGLHADEMPGVLVLHHLMGLLERAEAAGQLTGQVMVVPAANPIGLAQWVFQRPLGRQEAESLHNFNRGYPDLAKIVADDLTESLGDSAAGNLLLIRAALRQATARLRNNARNDMLEMQAALLHWSCDADHVLDLHCDHVAVMHLYASTARPDETALLARSVGAKLALIQDVSGGNAFDEANSTPWAALRERFGEAIPRGCFSTTLEYRGQFDVDDATALQDARNLMTYMAGIGVISGWVDTPAYPVPPMLPLGGAAEIFAPQGGVVTWDRAVGDMVLAGEVLGHVTNPATRLRLPITAPCPGMMFRRELWPSCLRGQGLAHVAGEIVLRDGDLLSD